MQQHHHPLRSHSGAGGRSSKKSMHSSSRQTGSSISHPPPPPQQRHRRAAAVVVAAAGGAAGLSPAAAQLLAQLQASSSAAPQAPSSRAVASVASNLSLPSLPSPGGPEAHFGSRIAQQLLERAEAVVGGSGGSVQLPSVTVPQLPQLSSVQVPQLPQLPSVQVPQLPQLPSVQVPQLPQLPDLSASGSILQGLSSSGAAVQDSLARTPEALQQQLQLLTSQLQQLGGSGAATASGAASSLEAHFGSHVFEQWLQSLSEVLSAALQSVGASLGAPASASAALAGDSLSAALSGLASSSSSIMGGFAGAVGSSQGLSAEVLAASWQALAGSVSASLPDSLSDSLDGLQAQAAGVAASMAALQHGAAQLAAGLQALPQHGAGGYSFATLCFVAAGALAALAASVPPPGATASGSDSGAELTHEYEPSAVEAYFKRRPVLVAQRSLQLALEAGRFGAALLGDLLTSRLAANEPQRALQLRGMIERVGPAAVKVAQALSTRVDLLSPQYFQQIQLLQDRVPPFPCDQAKEAMAAAFGRPVDEVCASISPRPVAAASLGQVYRARLKQQLGGGEVAVKVQRPDVLEQVCLDLHLMRGVAASISALPDVSTDWAALIDTWAVRFLHEMDYTREAANAALFRQQMAGAGVDGIVTADVFPELSNDTVLTTAWVDGEKLSESRAADVRELCNTLLSAYLIQLLDTGLLHADPHPGNLIRTPEGKICVLDFGLMTEVTPTQRIALFEYISHLLIEDWSKVAYDLQRLGFIPDDVGDDVLAEMAGPLGRILVQLSGGGGATKLNIDAVMAELENLGSTYPFSIPPFFALILRAFSVIEGIALTVDPDYSIVQECFPYLARRLLADDDPRVRQALRDVLYGGRARLDVDRLIRLSDAFSAYTTDGLAAGGAPAQQQAAPAAAGRSANSSGGAGAGVLSPAAKDALLAVFSRRGSYVQQLLVDELVAAADALSREAASESLRVLLASAPATLALSSLEAAGPLRPLLLPFTGPLELAARLAPAVALTPEDEEALGVVRGIFQLLQRLAPDSGSYSPPGAAAGGNAASGMVFSTTGGGGGGSPADALMRLRGASGVVDGRSALAAASEAVSDAASVAAELRPLLPELLPGLAATGQLFAQAYVARLTARASESFALSGAAEQEEALAMAALGFMPGARGSGQASGSSSAGGVWASSGFAGGAGVQQPQQPSSMLGASSGSSGLEALGRGFLAGVVAPTSPGQLITTLAAAPLLGLLAVASEAQRWQQQQPGAARQQDGGAGPRS